MKTVSPTAWNRQGLYVTAGVLLAVVVTGYPVAGFATAVADIEADMVSITFRLTAVVASLYVFVRYFDARVVI